MVWEAANPEKLNVGVKQRPSTMGAGDQTLVAECCERCTRELGIRLEVLGIMGFQALEHHGLSVLKNHTALHMSFSKCVLNEYKQNGGIYSYSIAGSRPA